MSVLLLLLISDLYKAGPLLIGALLLSGLSQILAVVAPMSVLLLLFDSGLVVSLMLLLALSVW